MEVLNLLVSADKIPRSRTGKYLDRRRLPGSAGTSQIRGDLACLRYCRCPANLLSQQHSRILLSSKFVSSHNI